MSIDSTSPANSAFRAGPNAELFFNVFFTDLDFVNYVGMACQQQGSQITNIPNPVYNIQFSTNNPMLSSFTVQGGGQAIENTNSFILSLGIPNVEPTIFSNETVPFFISPNWTAADGNIVVTATISENSQIPNNDMGGVQDPNVVFQWMISFEGQVPNALIRAFNPNNNQVTPRFGQYINLTENYYYQGAPDIPPAGQPDYLDVAVIEKFGTNNAAGFFTLGDLTQGFRNNPQNANLTPNQIANMLFSKGQNASFLFDMNDQFIDSHNAFFFNVDDLDITTVFDGNSVLLNRVGFSFTQTYHCNENQVGSATILKRLFIPPVGNPAFQVRKNHDF